MRGLVGHQLSGTRRLNGHYQSEQEYEWDGYQNNVESGQLQPTVLQDVVITGTSKKVRISLLKNEPSAPLFLWAGMRVIFGSGGTQKKYYITTHTFTSEDEASELIADGWNIIYFANEVDFIVTLPYGITTTRSGTPLDFVVELNGVKNNDTIYLIYNVSTTEVPDGAVYTGFSYLEKVEEI